METSVETIAKYMETVETGIIEEDYINDTKLTSFLMVSTVSTQNTIVSTMVSTVSRFCSACGHVSTQRLQICVLHDV